LVCTSRNTNTGLIRGYLANYWHRLMARNRGMLHHLLLLLNQGLEVGSDRVPETEPWWQWNIWRLLPWLSPANPICDLHAIWHRVDWHSGIRQGVSVAMAMLMLVIMSRQLQLDQVQLILKHHLGSLGLGKDIVWQLNPWRLREAIWDRRLRGRLRETG
jgi:hypothetical protein